MKVRDAKPPKYTVENDQEGVPIITFTAKVDGGMEAKYRVLASVTLDAIVEYEIVSESQLDRFINDICERNRKFYPSKPKAISVLDSIKMMILNA